MPEKKIVSLPIGAQTIQFAVLPSRGRRATLRYHSADRMFQVRVPGGRWTKEVEQFVISQESWIMGQLPAIHKDLALQRAWWDRVKMGKLSLRGQEYQFQTQVGRSPSLSIHQDQILLIGPAGAAVKQLLYLGLYHYARQILPQLVREYSQKTNTPVKRVVVKRTLRSKWGSASSLGNMNLNWLILLLPEPHIRYLIIHELMHFREMNHSPRFWAWVERFEPNYRAIDKNMKEWGWVFGLFEE